MRNKRISRSQVRLIKCNWLTVMLEKQLLFLINLEKGFKVVSNCFGIDHVIRERLFTSGKWLCRTLQDSRWCSSTSSSDLTLAVKISFTLECVSKNVFYLSSHWHHTSVFALNPPLMVQQQKQARRPAEQQSPVTWRCCRKRKHRCTGKQNYKLQRFCVRQQKLQRR